MTEHVGYVLDELQLSNPKMGLIKLSFLIKILTPFQNVGLTTSIKTAVERLCRALPFDTAVGRTI